MLIGYARVSTTDQSLNLQKDNLEKAGCEKIYHDVASGVADKRSGLEKLMRIKWHIWRGNVDNAVLRFEQLIARLPEKRKSKVIKLRNYIYNNRDKIVNYRERNKSGQVFTSNIAESNVESLINQRCKGKQHMQWSRKGLQPLMQIRAYIASNDWNLNWENVVFKGLLKAA